MLVPSDVTGALLEEVAERLRKWRKPFAWRTGDFEVTGNALAPHLGVPREVSVVSLGIPLPPDPAMEDWSPLSRATWSQLKALFGVDAPRADDRSVQEEVICVHPS